MAAIIIAVILAHSGTCSESALLWYAVSLNNRDITHSTLQDQTANGLQLECPADISTYTDINECSTDVSNSLNVKIISGTPASLTWEMTGATEGISSHTGINQIDNYTFNEGVTFVRYTAMDNAKNIADCSFTVTIIDNEAPVIVAPKNLTIKCDERIPSAHTTLQAFLNAGGFAKDNCKLLVSSFALASEVKDNKTCPYTLTRTYQISDEHGNVGIVKQRIFVLDQEGIISEMAVSNSGATATISYTKSNVSCRNDNNGYVHLILNGTTGVVTYAWSSRNGDGIIQGGKDQNSLTDGDYNVKVYEDGIYLLELNIDIQVADSEAPAITCPADITLECDQNVPAAFTNLSQFETAGGKASDNCQLNYASFRMFSETKNRQICPYILTRTYQISDVNGNVGKAEHFIFVNENVEPEPQQPLTLKSGMGIEADLSQTFTSNGTFTVPTGVTSVSVQVWGGGGAGGGINSKNRGGGGGAGGSFAGATINGLVPGANIPVTIGAGGTGVSGGDGNPGGNSSFGAYVIALGGPGGKVGNNTTPYGAGAIAPNNGNTGGTTNWYGGDGGNASSGNGSGGGGGSAGATGAGGNTTNNIAGTAGAGGGGAGAAGTKNNGNGTLATQIGGGGSGAYWRRYRKYW